MESQDAQEPTYLSSEARGQNGEVVRADEQWQKHFTHQSVRGERTPSLA